MFQKNALKIRVQRRLTIDRKKLTLSLSLLDGQVVWMSTASLLKKAEGIRADPTGIQVIRESEPEPLRFWARSKEHRVKILCDLVAFIDDFSEAVSHTRDV